MRAFCVPGTLPELSRVISSEPHNYDEGRHLNCNGNCEDLQTRPRSLSWWVEELGLEATRPALSYAIFFSSGKYWWGEEETVLCSQISYLQAVLVNSFHID